jgi:hypothetical protein
MANQCCDCNEDADVYLHHQEFRDVSDGTTGSCGYYYCNEHVPPEYKHLQTWGEQYVEPTRLGKQVTTLEQPD